ncbi:aldehyde dehydrogenase family protein [Metabacillus idriensis]|uniref:Aldehyde dehydrogenase family protein n=1 Tax=Metabacillus idriensis TaxID=324768 RepID=A0A6I2MET3_9BACI|nr:aldehyde dehydrogenase family protein [Metabacillus idriensis]MCM3598042.1 aldehyde dehydrogenase family protein [Metabacillus idriensis]MRX56850.1 aldehyde dehydrogenase family protein [Metabacillus idriensis]
MVTVKNKTITVQNYIGGNWVPSSKNQTYNRENPANIEETVSICPSSTTDDANHAIEAAHEAFKTWSQVPAISRAKYLYKFADLLESHKDEVAELLTREQGKPLSESLGEVNKTIGEVRYTAGEASRLSGETLPSERENVQIRTVRVPKGVIAAISPWNFPLVTPLRKIAPALSAGNTVVFKPASITGAMGAKITELFEKTGLPPGVLNLIIGSGRSVGNQIVNHPKVRGITFTGSTEVGSSIYQLASKRLVEVQLEMGGKNAAIIYDYPDVEGAVTQIVGAAFAAAGQRCTSISRIIINERDADRVYAALKEKAEEYVIGDGLESNTTMGPLVSKDQLITTQKYVEIGHEEGATLLTGGEIKIQEKDGYYFRPTIFTNVKSNSRLAKEEIFGPVLSIMTADSFTEAIEIMNDSEYGLAASCFTKNKDYADQFVAQAEAGMIHINNGTISESHVPFGGMKASAVGPYSIGSTAKDFFTDLKVIYNAN